MFVFFAAIITIILGTCRYTASRLCTQKTIWQMKFWGRGLLGQIRKRALIGWNKLSPRPIQVTNVKVTTKSWKTKKVEGEKQPGGNRRSGEAQRTRPVWERPSAGSGMRRPAQGGSWPRWFGMDPGGASRRSSRSAETWRGHIIQQLKHRDRIQSAMFQDLIRFCKNLGEQLGPVCAELHSKKADLRAHSSGSFFYLKSNVISTESGSVAEPDLQQLK